MFGMGMMCVDVAMRRLKIAWMLVCYACVPLLVVASYYRWPRWTIWATCIGMVVGQLVVGTIVSRARRNEPPPL